MILKNPAALRKKAQLKPFFQFYLRLIFCLKLSYNEIFDKVLHLEILQSWLMSDFKMDLV